MLRFAWNKKWKIIWVIIRNFLITCVILNMHRYCVILNVNVKISGLVVKMTKCWRNRCISQKRSKFDFSNLFLHFYAFSVDFQLISPFSSISSGFSRFLRRKKISSYIVSFVFLFVFHRVSGQNFAWRFLWNGTTHCNQFSPVVSIYRVGVQRGTFRSHA